MMQIGLIGYGKMGRAIEALAAEQNIGVAFRVTRDNRAELSAEQLQQADVVIEFTRPESAYENVMACLQAGVPVVSGTTGWADQLIQAQTFCRQQGGAFLHASNFSIGVNLFFALNRYLAQLMLRRPEYNPSITEIHHIHKLDAPSGTALTLAHAVLEMLDRKNNWVLAPTPPGPDDLPITAVREGEVPGTHIVSWDSGIDQIRLEHTAHSRAGFASGALLAASWLVGKTGVFSMEQVLEI